jgi:hypothetical protein
MTLTRSDRIKELRSVCDKIQTREDLIEYIELLGEAVDAGVFEKFDVGSYLDSIATVFFGMDSREDEQPSWEMIGHTLRKAFFR